MRCFIALLPPEPAVAAMAGFLAALAPRCPGWRPVRPEGVHLTLAFFGDLDEAGARDAAAAVEALGGSGAVAPVLAFGRIGAFPARGTPRVMVLEPAEGAAAARALRQALAGLLPAGRLRAAASGSFSPHLTLARAGRHAGGLPTGVVLPPELAGPAAFERAALMESIPGPGGSRYRVVARAELRGPA